ncbi:MAG: metallophosphoesterase family protein [Gaiellales bacterium]
MPLRRKKRQPRALRIFFATDVHGSDRCFRKFLNAADAYEADVLLLGGDVAGKGLVPVRRENGALHAEVRGEAVSVDAGEKDRLFSEINMLGFYPVEMDGSEIERLANDKDHVEQAFRREIITQLEGWCELAAERLRPEVRCIITPGNDDPFEIDAVLEAADRVECPERALCELGPVLLASMGDVTPTPWNTEREYSEEELSERIAAMLDQVPEGRSTVLNFHDPPYASGLDTAPELDEDLRPVLRGGRPSFVPVGSTAVRDAIKKYQPSVALHGHIHESRGGPNRGGTQGQITGPA